jgi:hypothetical protein
MYFEETINTVMLLNMTGVYWVLQKEIEITD